jgi:hypothetical protein
MALPPPIAPPYRSQAGHFLRTGWGLAHSHLLHAIVDEVPTYLFDHTCAARSGAISTSRPTDGTRRVSIGGEQEPTRPALPSSTPHTVGALPLPSMPVLSV